MDQLHTVLVNRLGRVHLPPTDGPVPADGDAFARVVETDLAGRGWLVDRSLRARLATLDPAERMRWADWLSATADASVAADRPQQPLFRTFPAIPVDVDALYIDRLLTHLLGGAGVPCLSCGDERDLAAVSPCGHVVCRTCFDPSAYAGCPICGRVTDGHDLFGRLDARDAATSTRPPAVPVRVVVLSAGTDPHLDAVVVRDELVARRTPLSEADQDDLAVVVAATDRTSLGWLPEIVPSRETLALVGAWALTATVADPAARDAALDEVCRRWVSATDAARLLWAFSGGAPSLVRPVRSPPGRNESRRPVGETDRDVEQPQVRALARPLRRRVLDALETMPPPHLAEDLERHATVWKRLAERLHPFEAPARRPGVVTAFAALRGTWTAADAALGAGIRRVVADHPATFTLLTRDDGRIGVRFRSFASAFDVAVADDDFPGALALASTRPGELWRRLDHLARLAGDDPGARAALVAAADASAARVSPSVLATAAASLRGREETVAMDAAAIAARVRAVRDAAAVAAVAAETVPEGQGWFRFPPATPAPVPPGAPAAPARSQVPRPGPDDPRRVFFPKGSTTRVFTTFETRDRLVSGTVDAVTRIADRELAGRGEPAAYDLAVVDAALATVPAPLQSRTATGQLAGWTRGSLVDLAADLDVLRLFLHWVQPSDLRVDLDLSCAFYDEHWAYVGHCDYTSLRFVGDAAVHSGDFTSAPAPGGATEYLDLRLPELLAAGARYAVPSVLSYSNTAFELLDDAVAGLALPTDRADGSFDPARVLQRFDLTGDTKVFTPFVLELATRRLMWLDVTLSTKGYGHNVAGNRGAIGHAAADLWAHFRAGRRTTVLDVVAWHVATRARRILLAGGDGWVEVPVAADAAVTVAAIRAATSATTQAADLAATGPLPIDVRSAVVLAATTDAHRAALALHGTPSPGSVAVVVTGDRFDGYRSVDPADLFATFAVDDAG